MITSKPIPLLATIWLTTIPAMAAPPPAVDLRTADGQVLIAANQIRAYNWEDHTLTLAPKVIDRLSTRLLRSRELASGVPFTLAVGGKPVYRGILTSVISSKSFNAPVVLIGFRAADEKLAPNQLRIQLGYPSADFFKGEDPRGDARVRKALRLTGKLSAEKEAQP